MSPTISNRSIRPWQKKTRPLLMVALPLLLAAAMGMQSGCVLPGGLQPVGGQLVEGRLVNPTGQGIPNQQLILLQGHFNRLNRKTVRYLDVNQVTRQLDRIVLWTDSEGRFSHKFAGFTHCHPIWIVPPLMTWPSQISGETRHGRFFILKTGLHIYEVTAGAPVPVIRVFDPERARLRSVEKSKIGDEITASSDKISWTYQSGSTGLVERVTLELVRK